MDNSRSEYPLIIIGAGAAGLGASEKASTLGIKHLVLEASHRIGGRGLTEMLENRYPVDLGCHWMHSASINPYVRWADALGFNYVKIKPQRALLKNTQWLSESQDREGLEFFDRMNRRMKLMATQGQDISIWDAIDQDDKWTPYFLYWTGLLHSNDADQVSILDVVNFHETHEDWPLMQGYGALIAAQGSGCPVKLDCAVERVDWRTSRVKLHTAKGQLTADKVLITVSTGILGAGDIHFTPDLPNWKQEAVNALPMGNSNYIFCSVKQGFLDEDVPRQICYQGNDLSLAFHAQQFGYPCLFTSTGGRFAWWMEKQGQKASIAMAVDALKDIFGSDIESNLVDFKVSAWGMDPWIRGAYSSAEPGKGNIRAELARDINECLYFAGEATSTDALNTAHGAYLSGHRAIGEIGNAFAANDSGW